MCHEFFVLPFNILNGRIGAEVVSLSFQFNLVLRSG